MADCGLDAEDIGRDHGAVTEEHIRAEEARRQRDRLLDARRLDDRAFGIRISCGSTSTGSGYSLLPHIELCVSCHAAPPEQRPPENG